MRHLAPLALLVLALAGKALAEHAQESPGPPEGRKVEELSLEELLDVRVVSASKIEEQLTEAPATVIVLTREEILRRGYTELSAVLDDLPGMDVVRPWGGTTYLKSYWRGYRRNIGEPFLLLLDGMVLNHLYSTTIDVLATLPISNVERIEVVYGPASAVYGPDAFMGVIHVITVKDKAEDGPSQTARLSAGSFGARIADVSLFYKMGDVRVSVAGRFENGELDPGVAGRYEYTKPAYYADRRLWGGFVDNPELGGRFSSPRRHRSLDVRARFRTLELGLQHSLLNAGYGVEYAADRAQNRAVWAKPELNLFLRARHEAGRLSSTTLLRYRRSDVAPDSYFVESLPGSVAGRPAQLVDFSYWKAFNSSWSLFQDFELRPREDFTLAAGLKYEQKALQKAYNERYGPSLPAEEVDAKTYPYPSPAFLPEAQNRIATEDQGVYVLGKWRAAERQTIHLGLRHDRNSQYGPATTLRAGYVGRFGRLGVKALYGEAFQEPNPRLLYGGWKGSGSDPDLRPERSRTAELRGSFDSRNSSSALSLYYVQNRDTIVSTPTGAENLGRRKVVGFDVHLQGLVRLRRLKQLRLWAYYSRILTADERRSDGGVADVRIGDLADDKVHLGATAVLDEHVSVTLRGRYIGPRPTVDTNPVGTVPGFTTLDLTVVGSDLFARGVGVALKVTNLLDEEYFHPGVRGANAGTTPGAFDASGAWRGSGGFYNSLLPQPGRAVIVSLLLDF